MGDPTVLSKMAKRAEAPFHYISGSPKREKSGTDHLSKDVCAFIKEEAKKVE